ncbi:hypothetical protein HMPREF9372_3439 [Sporosarcina newyorkensis 2681]|uniref:Uncharacterized protein n=1 Tax=Sporosarcina newyorkensis 2681 TaxID=1027292 RepID=F9DXA8_9BACL|nr:hypothetical protein HMPREF9372_3439 [Sporosarcina newyorkensis 2681]
MKIAMNGVRFLSLALNNYELHRKSEKLSVPVSCQLSFFFFIMGAEIPC